MERRLPPRAAALVALFVAAGMAGCTDPSSPVADGPAAEGGDGSPSPRPAERGPGSAGSSGEPGGEGRVSGTGDGSPPTRPGALRVGVSLTGPDLRRELDGFSGSPGTFSFSATVTGDESRAADVRWRIGDEDVSGAEVVVSLGEPGDVPVRVVATDASGRTAERDFVLRLPSAATHWYSGGLVRSWNTRNATVLVLPPAHASPGLPGAATTSSAACAHPAVLAAREAFDYWRWVLDESSAAYPQLANVSWVVRVAGCDATADDVRAPDMRFVLGGAAVPVPTAASSQSFGLACGATLPAIATSAETRSADPFDLRTVVLHEFGHCLGSGHTGEPVQTHCSSTYGCFDDHPDDVMSQGPTGGRRCLSNLNVQALAEHHGVGFDGQVFMLRENHQYLCMPDDLKRF